MTTTISPLVVRVRRRVRGAISRLARLLPDSVDRRVRVAAWFSLVFQIILIGTGGAVRLTASGLGCPTWPRCTESSFVNTPEMGLHGVIEFGNRLLTFVLVIVVIAAFLSVVRFRKARPDLFRLTLVQGLSIPFQAVLGGITVLTGLNPFVVGAHFVVSMVLVALTTVLLWRVYRGPRGVLLESPAWWRALVWSQAVAVAVTVTVGILTTGSGPHAGDNSDPANPAPRNGLDPELVQHVHSWPAYLSLALAIAIVIAAASLRMPVRWPVAVLSIELAQVAVGVVQARLGLPEILVGIHMVLAAVLAGATTALVLSLRSRDNSPRTTETLLRRSDAALRKDTALVE